MNTTDGPLTEEARDALDVLFRQVERPALLLAELLCGDAARADEALAAAMRAFRNAAARGPIDDWTQRFWSLLLAAPQLRAAAPRAGWPASMRLLARLPTGLRAAMLLRLVAGLDEVRAAAALGLPLPTYRAALERAWPRHPDGSPDADAWRALASVTQSSLQQLPAARLVRLAKLREHTLQAHPRAPAALGRHTRAAIPRRRWHASALLAVGVVAVVALASTWFRPAGPPEGGDFPVVQASPLPAAAAPAATYDGETALLTHPDFDQVADTRAAALVADLDFYAWYAARLAAQPGATTPLVLPDAATPLPEVRGAH
jgi:hypothetical protein